MNKPYRELDVPVSIVRSGRRSMSVVIDDEGNVTIRCPYSVSDRTIEKFAAEKADWIYKKVEERKRVSGELAAVYEYKEVLVDGIKTPLELGKRNGVFDGVVCAKSISRLEAVYTEEYGEKFLKEFSCLAERFGFHPTGVGFRRYKSRWGCCDIRGKITFNYKVLMLPRELRFYVAAHELTHLLVFDHSPAFRRELSKVDPKWSVHKKVLHTYSHIARLY